MIWEILWDYVFPAMGAFFIAYWAVSVLYYLKCIKDLLERRK